MKTHLILNFYIFNKHIYYPTHMYFSLDFQYIITTKTYFVNEKKHIKSFLFARLNIVKILILNLCILTIVFVSFPTKSTNNKENLCFFCLFFLFYLCLERAQKLYILFTKLCLGKHIGTATVSALKRLLPSVLFNVCMVS